MPFSDDDLLLTFGGLSTIRKFDNRAGIPLIHCYFVNSVLKMTLEKLTFSGGISLERQIFHPFKRLMSSELRSFKTS